jgi:hypothetical protein
MEICQGVVFLDFEGFEEVVDGVINQIRVSVTDSPLDVSVVLVLMLEVFDGFFKVVHGSFVAFLFSVNHSQIEQSFAICARTELQSFFEALDGFFELNFD